MQIVYGSPEVPVPDWKVPSAGNSQRELDVIVLVAVEFCSQLSVRLVVWIFSIPYAEVRLMLNVQVLVLAFSSQVQSVVMSDSWKVFLSPETSWVW